jgi:uncharacterized protein YndB with AHSA1/START domain
MSDPDAGGEVRLEIEIAASPNTVFSLLTEPERMQTWLAELVEAEPHPGGLFHVSDASGAAISGRYVELVTDRKVVFTWGGVEGLEPGQSTVEFLLEPVGTGTLLRLRHYRLPGSALESHRQGWLYSGLVKLKDAAEGCTPTELCLATITRPR